MGQIRIIGSKDFIETTKKALYLIKEKDPINYKIVIQNIGAIVLNKVTYNSYFDAFQEVPTFFVNEKTYKHNIEWYASGIVHEGYHGKLFQDAILDDEDPIQVYSGYEAEMYCLTKQIESMRRLGACKKDIEWAVSCYDKRWWEEKPKKRRKRKL